MDKNYISGATLTVLIVALLFYGLFKEDIILMVFSLIIISIFSYFVCTIKDKPQNMKKVNNK